MNQSSHPWNNAQFCTTTWFPGTENSSLHDSGVIQHINWAYTLEKYGSFDGKDFYHTNKEVLNGKSTLWGALFEKPTLVIKYWLNNVPVLLSVNASLTQIGRLLSTSFGQVGAVIGVLLIIFPILLIKTVRNDTLLFFLGSVLMVAVTIILYPKPRYFVPLVPFFSLAAYYYGLLLHRAISSVLFRTKRSMFFFCFLGALIPLFFLVISYYNNRHGGDIGVGRYSLTPQFLGGILMFTTLVTLAGTQLLGTSLARLTRHPVRFVAQLSVIPLVLVLFSNPFDYNKSWRGIVNDVVHGPYRLMEQDRFSLRRAFPTLQALAKDCSGLLAYEAKFFGSYLPTKTLRVFDVWEIPPFGHYNSGAYFGLRPDRIDCVFVSNELSDEIPGMSTNEKLRYDNYIQPYTTELLRTGGTLHDIPGYGFVVIAAPMTE